MRINKKRILIILISLVMVFTFIMFTKENKVESIEKPKSHTSLTTKEYTSSLVEIDAIDANQTITFDDVIAISSLISNSGYSYPNDLNTKLIRIDTASDLYHFMIMCNQNTAFNGCNFILGSDIDYSEQSAKGLYVTPIINFSGTFNGQGYTISNLYFKTLTPSDINSLNGLTSISMFNNNAGTIKNLGIVNTYIIQTQTFESVTAAATLVGTNTGTIENVFVTDLRTNKSGLICEGGYLCSSFVGANNGIVRNCYVAVNNIINETIRYQSDSSRCPVFLTNTGTVENVYFDSEVLTQRYNTTNSTYAQTKEYINNEFKNLNGWYTKDEYPVEFRAIFNNQYPLLQGLESVIISNQNFFIIESHIDFAIFYKMIKQYAAFRNAKYIVVDNIDLNKLNSTSLEPINIPFTGTIESAVRVAGGYSLILEDGTDFSGNVKLSDGSYSKCYSICNLTINQGISSGTGYKCFGLFPVLNGIVKDLNIYNITINIDDNSNIVNEPIVVGSITGLLNKGTISNCHVFGDINVNHTKEVDSNIGMIVGKNNASTTIEKVTSSGSINIGSTNSKVSCGGILGYVDNGLVQNCLNASSITFNGALNNVKDIIVGGVIGSGVTDSCTKLQNKGTIEVNSHTNLRGYISGVFGLHTNGVNAIGEFKNIGELKTKEIDTNTKMYVSGVMISKISTIDYVNYSSLTNSGTLTFEKSSSLGIVEMKETNTNTFGDTTTGNIDLHVCGNLFVIASNVNASGIYRNGNSDQNIDISIISEYAPCVRTHDTGNLSSYRVNLEQVYNTKNINYITKNEPQFHDIKLSGVISGGHVNLNQCRNEGNITLTFSNPSTNALNQYKSAYNSFCKTLRLYGVCEEIDQNLRGQNLYNGGDIKVETTINTSSNKIKYCIYVSGICSRNNASENIIDENTNEVPLMLTNVEGGLYNCLNDGNIDIDGSYEKSFYGVTRASGICTYNLSTIKNCYNLGNIYNRNYIEDIRGEYNDEAEVESSGIVFFMLGDSAAIIDCANNGNIISQNTSTSYSWVNAAGIILRNDKFENGSDASTNSTGHNHHKQKVEFSINYGNIYAFNNQVTNQVDGESRCKAAGILALGLCSIINVINYGNVYSVDTAGAMYGLVFMEKFGNANKDSAVYIANALNYGKVRRANNPTSDITNYTYQPSENTTWNQIGALIGIIKAADGNTRTSLEKVKISYLVNFDDRVDMIGGTSGFSNIDSAVDVIVETLQFMATLKEEDTSEAPFNINTTNGTGIKSYSLDNASPTTTITDTHNVNYYKASNNGGIFNENYSLRNPAPNSTVETDKYIADYFQYIGYSKINEYLIEKLGLNNTVVSVAYNMLMKDINSIRKLLQANNVNQTDYLDLFYKDNTAINQYNQFIQSNKEEVINILNQYITYTDDELYTLISQMTNDDYSSISNNQDVITIIQKVKENFNLNDVNTLFNTLFNATSFEEYTIDNLLSVLNEIDTHQEMKDARYNQNYQNINSLFNISSTDLNNENQLKTLFYNAYGINYDNFISSYQTNSLTQEYLRVANDIKRNINTTGSEHTYLNSFLGSYAASTGGTTGAYSIYIPTVYLVDELDKPIGFSYGVLNQNLREISASEMVEGGTYYFGGTHYNMDGTDPDTTSKILVKVLSDVNTNYVDNYQLGPSFENGKLIYRNEGTRSGSYFSVQTTEQQVYIKPNDYPNVYIYATVTRKAQTSYGFGSYYKIFEYTDFIVPTYLEVNYRDYVKLQSIFNVYDNLKLTEIIGHMINFASSDATSKLNLLKYLVLLNYQISSSTQPSNQEVINMLKEKNITNVGVLRTISDNLYQVVNGNSTLLSDSFKTSYVNDVITNNQTLKYAVDNRKLDSTDLKYIYLTLLLNDINNLNPNSNSLVTAQMQIDLMSLYIARQETLSLSETVYEGLTGSAIPHSNITEFESYLREKNLNPSDFLDFTGIYALASSQGILNGQFIPDNLKLPDIDPIVFEDNGYGEYIETTNTDWRNYNALNPDTTKVDYKVNVMMKQLKLSIATTVFKVTLTNTDKDVFFSNFDVKEIVDNTIKFDIPLNDELLKDSKSISVITSSNVSEYPANIVYIELANNAKIIRTDTYKYDISTLQVNDKLIFTFDVEAEDPTVVTTYKVEINLLPNKEIDQVLSAQIDGTNCSFVNNADFGNGITGTIVNNALNATGNNTFNANVQITNVTNGYNMNDHVRLYDSNGALVSSNYKLSATEVNNNSFNITFTPNEELPSGLYQIRCYINNDKYYPIEVEKAKSDKNDIISLTTLDGITHEGFTYIQNGNVKEIDINVQVGLEYHDNILLDKVFSPHATYVINSVHITSPTDFNDKTTPKTYTIDIDVTSESNISQKYLIRLNEYIDKTIDNIYENGRLMLNTEYTSNQDIITMDFEYNETPDYSFDMDLSGYMLSGNAKFVVGASSNNPSQDVSTSVLDNGFSITFPNEALSGEYVFYLMYNKSIDYGNGNTLGWDYVISKEIHITKNFNKNSYFDNIEFISETLIANQQTKITQTPIDPLNYNTTQSELTVNVDRIVYDTVGSQVSEFYVIGVVNKTDLTNYLPIFTLPEKGKVYRVEDITVKVFNDATQTYIDTPIETIVRDATINGVEMFVYEDIVTGTNYILVNNEYVITTDVVTYNALDGSDSSNTLRSDFINYNNDGAFKYVSYRLYSDEKLNNNLATQVLGYEYYTDYHIAVIDSTNVINFNISIIDTTSSINKVYINLTNYELIDDPLNSNNKIKDETQPISTMGKLAVYESGSWEMNKFQNSASGFFDFTVELPDGYEYILIVRGDEYYSSINNECGIKCEGDITTVTIDVEIRIFKIDIESNFVSSEGVYKQTENGVTMIETPKKWGVNYENESQNVEAQN